ncbi:DUF4240 domain-containing protein [Nonomuraea sp. NPDC049486]|uniref:DUF4240 domain-containing protein n=1 Tax=Nonomuraea sp. NPDC049486 TaxID=3155773 RepID=UPI00341FEEFB
MDVDEYWGLVERSGRETRTKEDRAGWLVERLSELSVEEILDYDAWHTRAENRACTWDVYVVCSSITGFGSYNGFEYFVQWLISFGRDAYEELVECPDKIVELPHVQRLRWLTRTYRHERTSWSRDGGFRLDRQTCTRLQKWPDEEWPEFELLGYVAHQAYDEAGGSDDNYMKGLRDRGVEARFPFCGYEEEPEGEAWDFEDPAEFVRRLPRTAYHYQSG